MDIARVIAVPLRAENYLPAKDLKTEKLLIMIHWGTTSVPDSFSTSTEVLDFQDTMSTIGNSGLKGPAAAALVRAAEIPLLMANTQRDQIDLRNAMMLGYDS